MTPGDRHPVWPWRSRCASSSNELAPGRAALLPHSEISNKPLSAWVFALSLDHWLCKDLPFPNLLSISNLHHRDFINNVVRTVTCFPKKLGLNIDDDTENLSLNLKQNSRCTKCTFEKKSWYLHESGNSRKQMLCPDLKTEAGMPCLWSLNQRKACGLYTWTITVIGTAPLKCAIKKSNFYFP